MIVHTQDERRTALVIAAEKGDAESVRLLLGAGANKEAWDMVRTRTLKLDLNP